MRLTLVTNADFGKVSNQKTEEAYATIKQFLDKKELSDIICRKSKKTKLKTHPISFIKKMLI